MKRTVYTVAGILAVGGMVGVWWFAEPTETPIERVAYERDIADQMVDVDGKLVRFIGLTVPKDALVEERDEGRFVMFDESAVTDAAMCNLLFKATAKKVDGQLVPEAKDLGEISDKGSQAVPVGACVATKSGAECLWNALFVGRDCLTVARSPAYLASDTVDLLKMPVEFRAKGVQVRKLVSVFDEAKQAMVSTDKIEQYASQPAEDILELMLTHGWSGRDDLNYQPAFRVYDEKTATYSMKKRLRYNPADYKNEVPNE